MAQLGKEYEFAQAIAQLQAQVRALSTQPVLLNASTGQDSGTTSINIDINGVHAYNSSGVNVVGMLASDGSVTAYDTGGNPVARFGPLTNSNPGNYGIEVKYNGSWAQVGAGNVDWSNISNKPSTFPPSAHTHSGSDITSQVSSAAGADGSPYGYNHAVAGTSFFAAWFGNDAGNHFGTNTSSIRGKRNVRRHRIGPDRILALKPVVYTKPANGDYVEYGLIAEQAVETLPEIVQWMDGKIHSIRYDLLAVALLELAQHQHREIDHQKAVNAAILAALAKAGVHVELPPDVDHPAHHTPETKANNPPPFPETPLPYEIEEV